MSEKHIYFVRHGESEYNVSDVILPHDTNLTVKGIQQAEFCAARCQTLSFDAIISSPLSRALETAEIINKKHLKQISASDLFTEYRYPLGVVGLKKTPALFMELINGSDQRFLGGEVFGDLKPRAAQALQFLESREESSLLVVSHAVFIYFLLTYVVFGETTSPRDFEKLFHTFLLSNTGITHCTFNNEKGRWRIVTWNDDAHLGIPAENN